jgi:hypothetical protein
VRLEKCTHFCACKKMTSSSVLDECFLSLFFFSREEEEKTRSNTKILVGPFLEEEEEDKEDKDKEEEKAFTSVIIIIIIIALLLLLLLLLRVVRGSAPKVHGVKVFYNHRKKFRTLNTTTTARARFR